MQSPPVPSSPPCAAHRKSIGHSLHLSNLLDSFPTESRHHEQMRRIMEGPSRKRAKKMPCPVARPGKASSVRQTIHSGTYSHLSLEPIHGWNQVPFLVDEHLVLLEGLP